MSAELINALLQIPIVVALIYLVLTLEDKRQASAKLREETNQKVIDSLLGIIDELAGQAQPDKVSSRQLRLIQDYLEEQNKNSQK